MNIKKLSTLITAVVIGLSSFSQHLTISNSGQTGTSGTNWSITGNTLNVAASGSANVHPSVITNHLSNTGSLTITLPAQASVQRDIYINNTIAYTGSNARTLTFNAANDLIVASGVSITSSTAAMNLVLRSIFSAGVPDYGRIQLNGTTINTNGGHFWAGGGSGNTTWNGLTVGNTYSRTWADDVAGISFIGSSLNSSGGNIYMAGMSFNTSDGDGENYGVNIRNSAITSGIGQIDILGDLRGMYGTGSGLGIFGNEGPVSISATSGAVNLTGTGVDQAGTNTGWRRGLLLYTLSTSGISVTSTSGNISITGSAAFPINANDDMIGIQLGSTQAIADGVKITSQTGNIIFAGSNSRENAGQNSNAVQFIAANVANSIRIGNDGTNAYSGNITIEGNSIIQNNINAGSGSISVRSTGALTIQPSGAAFTYLRAGSGTLNFDDDWNFGSSLSGFTFGKSTNTLDLSYGRPLTVAGPITFHVGNFTINENITASTASAITINARGNFNTDNVSRQTISSNNGNISIIADSDANGVGTLDLDRLTINPGSGNIIVRGEAASWGVGSVDGPFINGTGGFTFESSDASFGQDMYTSWFEIDQDGNGISALSFGKLGSTQNVYQNTNLTIAGPVSYIGGTLGINGVLTATNSDINLRATSSVTQTQPITANGLSLNGTGTFTLTNTSNNFTTIAGGEIGTLLGATQIIDVSGGLTIGTVGSNTGLLSSSTIRVETLAGNLTFAGSINTTSTSTDAVILTSAKNTAIGVPTGGDIIVSGSPTITMGSGAIAKLFSGYDQTSTGLTALAGGVSNARYNYDETTTTFNPVLSANNRYAIYRTAEGYGDLTIVSSGGDAEGTTWNYVNGVIKTLSGTANVLNTVVQSKLNSANLSIEANRIIFSANVTGTTSNTLSILAKTHIVNTNATTITTQGGSVLLASNVDDATDNETTVNGYILFGSGLTITTNGGNITLGGGNVTGSDYALGTSAYPYEGIRVDNIVNLNSGGGNIIMRGKSYAIATTAGAWGVGFWNLSTGSIASGTGAITLDGFSQSSGGSHSSGLYSYGALTITSANTTANAIQMIGKSTGTSGEAWGIEAESALSLLATGTGGGITVSSSQQNSGNNFDIVLRGETNILASSGPINLLGGQSGGLTNGTMFLGNNLFLGSKASSAVPASSSNLTIQYNLYNFSGFPARLASSGTLDWKPVSASFGQNVATDFFFWGQNGQTLSGLTIGKPGNAGNLYLNSTFTVAGPINAYGGYVEVSGTISNPGTNDIFLKGISNSGSSVNVFGTITKTSGTGTLTMQAHGRAINSGTISATGTGVLNLVMWSDFDGDNVGGGSTLNGGSVSTNGGHVWLGGSNSNGGSYTWNGLTVGDGPSTGASGSNCHAIDLFSPITTNGGDVLLWASNNGGCGISGIQSDGTRHINAGSGDITLIAFQTGGGIDLTSTGLISLLPTAGSYPSALTIAGTLTSGNFSINTSLYNGLKINGMANTGLVIGNYSGHLSSGVAVAQGNSSNVTVSSALTTKSLEIYGGAIALNENITTTGTNADVLIKAMSNINLAASKTVTTNAGDVNLWADSDDNATGYVQLLAGATINSTGGDINLGGGSSLATDYAFGTTAETCPEVVGTQYISGVHLRQSSSLNSNGGNISLRGQNANTSASAMSFGISFRGVTINSGTGRIAINGIANGSGSVNAQAVASWGTLTLRSANTSADAISITGNALTSVGGSSLGVNVVALFEATGAGGGISIIGKSGVASTNASVNLGGDILAASGPITISGENASGIQNNIFIGSTTVIGKKSGTNVTSSSSNVILEGNTITTSGAVTVDCSGTLTVQPFGNSFASALTWPMPNVSLASSITGLTIGKPTNTSNVTFTNATTINGPITAYGGAITVSAAVSAAGNILLDGDAGSFLSQNTKGVAINAAVSTSNNGNITILGRGGNATATNTHGINVNNLVEAGGTGNIQITGYGGLSFDNSTGSSSHGVNIEGANAWVKSNGGNVLITGYGGGAGTGTYSQGVPLLTNARVSAAGSGTISINGTGGVNSAIGLRGVVMTSGSSVYTAGGAITITGINGTNGSDNSDGVTIDNSTIGSNSSGNITIIGTAGGGSGSEAITLGNTNTLGGANHTNNVLLRGNSFAISGNTSVITYGQVTVEPYTNSFSSALTFPISSMTIANTITGLTIGKSTNSGNVTLANTTSINGPITVYGGTLTVNQNVASSAGSTISLYGNALNIASGKTITSSGQLIVTTQDTTATIGLAGASGTLQLPAGYFSANFTDGFSSIQIGRSNQTGAIAANNFTLRDNMIILTNGTLTLGGKPVLGSNNVTLGPGITTINVGNPANYFQTNSTGKVFRSIPNGSSLSFPVGKAYYNPLTITNNTGSTDEFSARVLDSVFLNGFSGPLITAAHVKATWDINKANSNSGSGIDLEFGWDQAQETTTINSYILNHFNSTSWEIASGTSQAASGTTFKTMLHEDYTGSFSPFAIGEDDFALPVEMISFGVNCAENLPVLEWKTASEHNSSHFNIERSQDGDSWEFIGLIDAAGNSTNTISYSFTDQHPVVRQITYYRIVQFDIDGKHEVFGPISSNCFELDAFDMLISPNPNSGKFVLQFASEYEQEIKISIYSAEGKVVSIETVSLTQGLTNGYFDLSNALSGVYTVYVEHSKGSLRRKMVVQ